MVELEYTPEFKRATRKLSRRYRSIRTDIEGILNALESGEVLGDLLQHVGCSAYKVRLQNSDNNKGKSAGYRVVYYIKTASKIVLVTLYSKSDQSDVPADEIERIVAKYERWD